MGNLPSQYYKIGEEDSGIYDLVMLAGFEPFGVAKDRKVLYVCKSRNGYLNEAFEWSDVGKIWGMVYGDEKWL